MARPETKPSAHPDTLDLPTAENDAALDRLTAELTRTPLVLVDEVQQLVAPVSFGKPRRQGDIRVKRVGPPQQLPPAPGHRDSRRAVVPITVPDPLFGGRASVLARLLRRPDPNLHVLVPAGPVGVRRHLIDGQLSFTVLVPEGSTARLEHQGRTAHHRPLYLPPGVWELTGKAGAVYPISD
ncbi:hypothetical protein ACIB24_12560 [Spongisporangium articulatum]|uniref:Uncharacterized protein n=1 Tax=Spongisporangium articulatum TaxID=3362603 RepID=A0ABW8ANH3_9ACTN